MYDIQEKQDIQFLQKHPIISLTFYYWYLHETIEYFIFKIYFDPLSSK